MEGDDMTADILSWLKEQILARKSTAEAASKGVWKVGETEEYLGAIAIVGDDTTVTAHSPEIASGGYEGGGVWEREDADHIVLNQPRDVDARCEFEMAIVEEHVPVHAWRPFTDWPGHHPDGCQKCVIWVKPGIAEEEVFPCVTLRRLAYAYRHRNGWREEWRP